MCLKIRETWSTSKYGAWRHFVYCWLLDIPMAPQSLLFLQSVNGHQNGCIAISPCVEVPQVTMSQRAGPGNPRKRGHQHHPRNESTRRRAALEPPSNTNVIESASKAPCDNPQVIVECDKDMSTVFRPAAEGSSQSDQEEVDPEIEELARLRCTSERTEVVAERETRRRGRRCADYPGLAFASSIFSSDTLIKFSIIRNELHNIMNTQLKRVGHGAPGPGGLSHWQDKI